MVERPAPTTSYYSVAPDLFYIHEKAAKPAVAAGSVLTTALFGRGVAAPVIHMQDRRGRARGEAPRVAGAPRRCPAPRPATRPESGAPLGEQLEVGEDGRAR